MMKKTLAKYLKTGDIVIACAASPKNSRPYGRLSQLQRIDTVFMQFRPRDVVKSDYMLRFSTNGQELFNSVWHQGTMMLHPDLPVWIQN